MCTVLFMPMTWQIYLLRIINKTGHVVGCARAPRKTPRQRSRRCFAGWVHGIVVLLWITFAAAVLKKCANAHRPQTRMNAGFPDKVQKLSTMHTSYDGRYVKYSALSIYFASLRECGHNARHDP